MKWSWKLGTFAGIGVFVHWTFAILVVWVLAAYLATGSGWAAAAEITALLLAVFTCVVLHEFGHALTARRYGINTKDITLLPIGGIARLERIPEKPAQELWVALAGPAVNVAIAAGLFGIIAFFGEMDRLFAVTMLGGHFLAKLMWINVFLAGFNLLPAFPMDGGRVLRALMAFRLPYLEATEIAAGIGRTMAVLFAVAGLFVDWWLLLIAAFVFLAADAEAQMVRTRSILQGAPVGEAMVARVSSISADQPINDAIAELQTGWQRDLPVVDGQRLVGLLSRADVIRAIGEGDSGAPVRRFMNGQCPVAEETEPMETSYWRMLSEGYRTLPVVRTGRLAGVVTLESINNWMTIHAAGQRPNRGPAAWPVAGGSRNSKQSGTSQAPFSERGDRIPYNGTGNGHKLNTEGDVTPSKDSAPIDWHEKCIASGK